jgi:hypothetical protein
VIEYIEQALLSAIANAEIEPMLSQLDKFRRVSPRLSWWAQLVDWQMVVAENLYPELHALRFPGGAA